MKRNLQVSVIVALFLEYLKSVLFLLFSLKCILGMSIFYNINVESTANIGTLNSQRLGVSMERNVEVSAVAAPLLVDLESGWLLFLSFYPTV